jgi:hypothetical protein
MKNPLLCKLRGHTDNGAKEKQKRPTLFESDNIYYELALSVDWLLWKALP